MLEDIVVAKVATAFASAVPSGAWGMVVASWRGELELGTTTIAWRTDGASVFDLVALWGRRAASIFDLARRVSWRRGGASP